MTEQQYIQNSLALVEVDGEPRIDSRIVAEQLGIDLCALSSDDDGTVPDSMGVLGLMDVAVHLSMSGNTTSSIRALHLADNLCPFFPYTHLRAAVHLEICRNLQAISIRPSNNKHGEFAIVHYWFRNNHTVVIPGSSLVKQSRVIGYNPDFFIEVNSFIYPVECKKTFNSRSLNQLTDYMVAYGAEKGYAVGIKLKTNLPPSIQWIECPMPTGEPAPAFAPQQRTLHQCNPDGTATSCS